MRIALIGAGRIGRHHARVLACLAGVEELVVADATPGAADETVRIVAGSGPAAVRVAESPLAAIEAVDAVVIAAATSAHPELIELALRSNRPTFCEKPLAMDLARAIELTALVERSGVAFQIGFQRRFDPGFAAARRMIAGGELGTLYAMRFASHDANPPPAAFRAGSGGLALDLGIHDFDLMRWLTGSEVVEIYLRGGVPVGGASPSEPTQDTAAGTAIMADGTLAVVTLARHDPRGHEVRAEIFGARDSVAIGLGPRTPLRPADPDGYAPGGSPWQGFLDRFETAYQAELQAFLELAAGHGASQATARDGLEAMRIAEAGAISMREHRPVALSEIRR